MSANPAIAASDAEVVVVALADDQAAFDFDFPIYAADQLAVYINATLMTLTTHYTASGLEVADGGTVTFEAAAAAMIAAGDEITIRRVTPAVRISKYFQDGDFRAYTVNRDFDLGVMRDQELRRDFDTGMADISALETGLASEIVTRAAADAGLAEALALLGAPAASVVPWVTDRAALSALPTTLKVAILKGDGLWEWIGTSLAAEVTADPQQASVVPPLTDTSGASGAWRRIVTGPAQASWWRALGDVSVSDWEEVQATVNAFKSRDTTGLPPAAAPTWRVRELTGYQLDLRGTLGRREFRIDAEINLDGVHGLKMGNGNLWADGVWADANKSILRGDNAANVVLEDLGIECNDLSNGMWLDRFVKLRMRNVQVFGFGKKLWGIKSATVFGGMKWNIDGLNLIGTIAGQTSGALVATHVATGLLVAGGSDCTVVNSDIERCGVAGADISSGGWRFRNVHFGGLDDSVDARGLILRIGGANSAIGCHFDGAVLELVGPVVRTIEVNHFQNNISGAVVRPIIYTPTAASQLMVVGSIQNNTGDLVLPDNNRDFISINNTGGFTVDGVGLSRIGNNLPKRGASTTFMRPRETFGHFRVVVEAADWVASGGGFKTFVDMNNFLLHPQPATHATKMHAVVSIVADAHTASITGNFYDKAAGKLHVYASAAADMELSIYYTWGAQAIDLVAAAA